MRMKFEVGEVQFGRCCTPEDEFFPNCGHVSCEECDCCLGEDINEPMYETGDGVFLCGNCYDGLLDVYDEDGEFYE